MGRHPFLCISLDEMMYDRIVFTTNFSVLKFLPVHIICLLFFFMLDVMRINAYPFLLGGMPFEKACTSKQKLAGISSEMAVGMMYIPMVSIRKLFLDIQIVTNAWPKH